mmetsp:Transcript_55563/g.119264  ORF Transcript_55563/g.119264 Transcript_55563/m.119264 type:complete len:252 (+) Transcript_55563:1781-2536(+)
MLMLPTLGTKNCGCGVGCWGWSIISAGTPAALGSRARIGNGGGPPGFACCRASARVPANGTSKFKADRFEMLWSPAFAAAAFEGARGGGISGIGLFFIASRAASPDNDLGASENAFAFAGGPNSLIGLLGGPSFGRIILGGSKFKADNVLVAVTDSRRSRFGCSRWPRKSLNLWLAMLRESGLALPGGPPGGCAPPMAGAGGALPAWTGGGGGGAPAGFGSAKEGPGLRPGCADPATGALVSFFFLSRRLG